MKRSIQGFLGDSLGNVLIRLLFYSFLIGFILTIFNWRPTDIFFKIGDILASLWSLGFHAFDGLFQILGTGAVLVIPIFLLMRLLNWKK